MGDRYEGDARIIVGSTEVNVRCACDVRRRDATGLSDWDGTYLNADAEDLEASEATLLLPDGRHGQIIIGPIAQGGAGTFTGTGAAPA